MKIVFVHQNFPGQFGRLAAIFASEGHEVVALGTVKICAVPGVTYYPYTPVPGPDGNAFHGRFAPVLGPPATRLWRRHPGPRPREAGLRAGPRRGQYRLGRKPVPEGYLAEGAARRLFRILLRGEGPGRGLRSGIPRPQRGADLAAAGQERHAACGAFDVADAAVAPTRYPARYLPGLCAGTGSRSSTTASRRRTCGRIRRRRSRSAANGPRLDRSVPVVTYVTRNIEPMRGCHIVHPQPARYPRPRSAPACRRHRRDRVELSAPPPAGRTLARPFPGQRREARRLVARPFRRAGALQAVRARAAGLLGRTST